jgi:hypothetical protein
VEVRGDVTERLRDVPTAAVAGSPSRLARRVSPSPDRRVCVDPGAVVLRARIVCVTLLLLCRENLAMPTPIGVDISVNIDDVAELSIGESLEVDTYSHSEFELEDTSDGSDPAEIPDVLPENSESVKFLLLTASRYHRDIKYSLTEKSGNPKYFSFDQPLLLYGENALDRLDGTVKSEVLKLKNVTGNVVTVGLWVGRETS